MPWQHPVKVKQSLLEFYRKLDGRFNMQKLEREAVASQCSLNSFTAFMSNTGSVQVCSKLTFYNLHYLRRF